MLGVDVSRNRFLVVRLRIAAGLTLALALAVVGAGYAAGDPSELPPEGESSSCRASAIRIGEHEPLVANRSGGRCADDEAVARPPQKSPADAAANEPHAVVSGAYARTRDGDTTTGDADEQAELTFAEAGAASAVITDGTQSVAATGARSEASVRCVDGRPLFESRSRLAKATDGIRTVAIPEDDPATPQDESHVHLGPIHLNHTDGPVTDGDVTTLTRRAVSVEGDAEAVLAEATVGITGNPCSGRITVVNDTIPDGPEDFLFRGLGDPFALDDDSDPTLPSSQTRDLAPGLYAIEEQAPAGFELREARCTGDQPPAARGATVDLQVTEDVTCTFVNQAVRPGPVTGPQDSPAPDPADSAPPVDQTEATSFADATKFLYSGPDPIQPGVDAGAVKEATVAVLRGRVLNRMGGPVAGVRVAVLDQPALGRTATRDDGGFDIAVNGGGPVVLEFERAGYLPVQRTVEAPWKDYAAVDDVVMIPYDGHATEVDLSEPGTKVHRAREVTDTDGTRQATIMVPEGTGAEMVMPDGERRSLDTITLRATEYTIGQTGPEAMPGELPPSSAYTYAVELSVDEAVEAGAAEVRFDRAVHFYVDNFLGFPAGTNVPIGYLDRQRGEWVGAPDGRVVEIISETEGKADLDVTGDGAPDTGAALEALGVTDEERLQLARLYEPDQGLWRVAMDHFTPLDCNLPPGPPPDAIPPSPPEPIDNRPEPEKECYGDGSIIGCQSQTLGQRLRVAGTSLSLNYWSDRTPGRQESRSLEIPLTPKRIPASLSEVLLEIRVAGRTFEHSFGPAPNLRHTFVWDGLDVYGRRLQGEQPIEIGLGYRYDQVEYRTNEEAGASWARFGSTTIDGSFSRRDFVAWRRWRSTVEGPIGVIDARAHGLGGWSLSAHHLYDPNTGTVYLGDGRKLTYDMVVRTVAGGGGTGPGQAGDGGPATSARFYLLYDVEVAPDGSLYVSELVRDTSSGSVDFYGLVRRVKPDGVIETVAGGGTAEPRGVPATDARIAAPTEIALGRDGTLYLGVDGVQGASGPVVLNISPGGQIDVFAGGGESEAEGVPGTDVRLPFGFRVEALEAATDGSVYVGVGTTVFQVGTDGTVATFAGGGNPADGLGDGGPPSLARLGDVRDLTVGPEGEVYISHGSIEALWPARVRRVDTGGTITTFAGRGWPSDPPGAGGPATEAAVEPNGLAIGPDASLLFTDYGVGDRPASIQRVAPDGRITTLAGEGVSQADGVAPNQASVKLAGALSVAPNGAIYLTELNLPPGAVTGEYIIRRIAPPPVKGATGKPLLPSADGEEAYEFDLDGRHLRTLDGLTGAVRASFAYDSAGLLTSITDAVGNRVTIDRDTAGAPGAIVAPGGQQTTLDLHGNGYLSRVTDPTGAATSFTYTADGLMQTLTDPRGGVHRFGFDGGGWLVRDEDPENGVQTLSRTRLERGYRVTRRSALGREEAYSVERLARGGLRLATTDAAGGTTTVLSHPDGSQDGTYPDGASVRLTRGPDPRWDWRVPVTTRLVQTTPAGRTLTATQTATATLRDPLDPTSASRVMHSVSVGGNTTQSTYDRAGGTITTTSPQGRRSVVTLDALARPARLEPALGIAPVEVTYDPQGRPARVAQGTQSFTYTYDAEGRVATRTDATGRTTRWSYDGADRVRELTTPSGGMLRFGRNPAGDLSSVQMPDGDSHRLGSDLLGRLTRFTPLGSSQSQTFAYDRDRALGDVTLAGGRVVSHGRDTGGRPSGQRYDEAVTTFGYEGARQDPATLEWQPAAGGMSQRLALQSDGDVPLSVESTGPAAGRFDYGYDENLNLASIGLTSGSQTVTTSIARDRDGLLTGLGPFTLTRSPGTALVTRISDSALSLVFGHDQLGNVADRNVAAASRQIYRAQLTRDPAGRISRKVETVGGAVQTFDYRYDLDGRLVRVDRNGVVAESYTYDLNGNRTSSQTGAGPAQTLTYDAQERVSARGTVPYGFDADGFLATRGSDRFTYSARGELLSAQSGSRTVTYAYDALGRRVARTEASQTAQYLYGNPADPFQVSAVRDGAGTLTFYYYDEDGLLFAMQRGGTRHYIATDQVGTPRAVTNTSGTVVKALTFDSFGNLLSDSAPGFELPFGFAGGLADPVTGLVRFGFRDYDPATGRWTARDPVLFRGGQANLYAYAGSDPVNGRDPTGLFCVGGSVYAWYGGGAEVCITDEGFSVCAEVGFGYGTDAKLETGDLADDGQSVLGEVKAELGPLSAKVGAELDETGCLSLAGPEIELAETVTVRYDGEGPPGLGVQPKVEVEGGRTELLKIKKLQIQGKVAGRICRKFAG